MFSSKVTLFNYSESENMYYKTFLENVEFQPYYKTSFDGDFAKDEDSSLLIVNYCIDSGSKKPFGSERVFKTPKIWETLENKGDFFTLRPGFDFFVKGDFTEVNSGYEDLKNSYDDVFFIQSVKDFEDDLKHWEIMGY